MENWKPVKGFEEQYEVSDQGRIRRLDTMKFRKLSFNSKGYAEVTLYKPELKYPKHWRINRLVAEHFLENPENKEQVNHKNGIKSDNRAYNLEWTTALENTTHALNNGLRSRIPPNRKRVLNVELQKEFTSTYDAAEWMNVNTFKSSKRTSFIAAKIRGVCTYQYGRKTAYGYKWKYIDERSETSAKHVGRNPEKENPEKYRNKK